MLNNNLYHKNWKKAVSLVLVCLFFLNDISWAIPSYPKNTAEATLQVDSICGNITDPTGKSLENAKLLAELEYAKAVFIRSLGKIPWHDLAAEIDKMLSGRGEEFTQNGFEIINDPQKSKSNAEKGFISFCIKSNGTKKQYRIKIDASCKGLAEANAEGKIRIEEIVPESITTSLSETSRTGLKKDAQAKAKNRPREKLFGKTKQEVIEFAKRMDAKRNERVTEYRVRETLRVLPKEHKREYIEALHVFIGDEDAFARKVDGEVPLDKVPYECLVGLFTDEADRKIEELEKEKDSTSMRMSAENKALLIVLGSGIPSFVADDGSVVVSGKRKGWIRAAEEKGRYVYFTRPGEMAQAVCAASLRFKGSKVLEEITRRLPRGKETADLAREKIKEEEAAQGKPLSEERRHETITSVLKEKWEKAVYEGKKIKEIDVRFRGEKETATKEDANGSRAGHIGKATETEPIHIEGNRVVGKIRMLEKGEEIDLVAIPQEEASEERINSMLRKVEGTLISGLTHEDEQEAKAILEEIMKMLKEKKPRVFFTKIAKGKFLGAGRPGLIVMFGGISHNPLAFLHESIECFRDSKILFRGRQVTVVDAITDLLDPFSRDFVISHEAKYAAKKQGQFFEENRDHYIIRAFLGQIFPEQDDVLTTHIKIMKTDAVAVREEDRREIETVLESTFSPQDAEWLMWLVDENGIGLEQFKRTAIYTCKDDPMKKREIQGAFHQIRQDLEDDPKSAKERATNFLGYLSQCSKRTRLSHGESGLTAEMEKDQFAMGIDLPAAISCELDACGVKVLKTAEKEAYYLYFHTQKEGISETKRRKMKKNVEEYNVFFDLQDEALDILGRPNAKPRPFLERAGKMIEQYRKIFGEQEKDTAEKAAEILDRFRKDMATNGRIPAGMKTMRPSWNAMTAAIEEVKTPHELINYLHQRAEHMVFSVVVSPHEEMRTMHKNDDRFMHNRKIVLSTEDIWKEREYTLIDLNEHGQGPAEVSEFLEKIAETFFTLEDVRIFTYGRQIWMYLMLGKHSARVYIDLSSPTETGRVEIDYRDWGSDNKCKLRTEFLEKYLGGEGFCATTTKSSKGYGLKAFFSKESGAVSLEDILQAVRSMNNFLCATDVDLGLNEMEFFYPPAKYRQLSRNWRSHLREGFLHYYSLVLPPGQIDAVGLLRSSDRDPVTGKWPIWEPLQEAPYTDLYVAWQKSKGEEVKEALNDILKGLNAQAKREVFKLMPEGLSVSKRSVEEYFNIPIKKAIERMEFLVDENGFIKKNPDYQAEPDMDTLLSCLKDNTENWAKTAEALSGLKGARVQEIGFIGGYTVEKSEFPTLGEPFTFFALRDPITRHADQAVCVRGGHFARIGKDGDWKTNIIINPETIKKEMIKHGYSVKTAGTSRGKIKVTADIIREKLSENIVGSIDPGEIVECLPASAGMGIGEIVFAEGKNADDLAGKVCVLDKLTPNDIPRVGKAAAVMVMRGNVVGHAFILLREQGVPAIVIGGEKEDNAKKELVLDLWERTNIDKEIDGYSVRQVQRGEKRGVVLKDGDMVVVDGNKGKVMIPGTLVINGNKALVQQGKDMKRGHILLRQGEETIPGTDHTTEALLAAENVETLKFLVYEAMINEMNTRSGNGKNRIGKGLKKVLEQRGKWSGIDEYLIRLTEHKRMETQRTVGYMQGRLPLINTRMEGFTLIGRLFDEVDATNNLERAVGQAIEGVKVTGYAEIKRRMIQLLGQRMEDFKYSLEEELDWWEEKSKEVTAGKYTKINTLLRTAAETGIDISRYGALLQQMNGLIPVIEEKAAERQARRIFPFGKKVDNGGFDIGEEQAALMGNKGAKLFEMASLPGISVPPGFVIGAKGYEDFTGQKVIIDGRETTVGMEIENILRNKEKSPSDKAKKIKEIFIGTPFPEGLEQEVVKAYEQMRGGAVAVRSSADIEDDPEHSFAGQFETEFTKGKNELMNSVKNVWVSLWGERAIEYMSARSIDPGDVRMSVIVQELVEADSSGVAFSVDVTGNNYDKMIINAGWGLGETIVTGTQDADRYEIDDLTGEITQDMGDKAVMAKMRDDLKGIEQKEVELYLRKTYTLTEAEIRKLGDVTRSLSEYYGHPVDVEFAFKEGKLYVLQVREITTLDIAFGRNVYGASSSLSGIQKSLGKIENGRIHKEALWYFNRMMLLLLKLDKKSLQGMLSYPKFQEQVAKIEEECAKEETGGVIAQLLSLKEMLGRMRKIIEDYYFLFSVRNDPFARAIHDKKNTIFWWTYRGREIDDDGYLFLGDNNTFFYAGKENAGKEVALSVEDGVIRAELLPEASSVIFDTVKNICRRVNKTGLFAHKKQVLFSVPAENFLKNTPGSITELEGGKVKVISYPIVGGTAIQVKTTLAPDAGRFTYDMSKVSDAFNLIRNASSPLFKRINKYTRSIYYRDMGNETMTAVPGGITLINAEKTKDPLDVADLIVGANEQHYLQELISRKGLIQEDIARTMGTERIRSIEEKFLGTAGMLAMAEFRDGRKRFGGKDVRNARRYLEQAKDTFGSIGPNIERMLTPMGKNLLKSFAVRIDKLEEKGHGRKPAYETKGIQISLKNKGNYNRDKEIERVSGQQNNKITIAKNEINGLANDIEFRIDVDKFKEEGFGQEKIAEILKYAIKTRGPDLLEHISGIDTSRPITIAVLDGSEAPFENHLKDNFIGINKIVFEIFKDDPELFEIMLIIGLSHELVHEAREDVTEEELTYQDIRLTTRLFNEYFKEWTVRQKKLEEFFGRIGDKTEKVEGDYLDTLGKVISMLQATVKVRGSTGTVVDEDEKYYYVITARHVVEDLVIAAQYRQAARETVYDSTGKGYPAEVLFFPGDELDKKDTTAFVKNKFQTIDFNDIAVIRVQKSKENNIKAVKFLQGTGKDQGANAWMVWQRGSDTDVVKWKYDLMSMFGGNSLYVDPVGVPVDMDMYEGASGAPIIVFSKEGPVLRGIFSQGRWERKRGSGETRTYFLATPAEHIAPFFRKIEAKKEFSSLPELGGGEWFKETIKAKKGKEVKTAIKLRRGTEMIRLHTNVLSDDPRRWTTFEADMMQSDGGIYDDNGVKWIFDDDDRSRVGVVLPAEYEGPREMNVSHVIGGSELPTSGSNATIVVEPEPENKAEKCRVVPEEERLIQYIEEIETSPEVSRDIAATFLSFREYVEECLYNKSFGYYMTGKVKIGVEQKKSDFNTDVEKLSPAFGWMIAEQAFKMRKLMIAGGVLGCDEEFTIVEMGAGNGTLAKDVLEYMDKKANEDKDKAWQDFYENMKYIIVEKAKALREKQAQTIKILGSRLAARTDIKEGAATSLEGVFDPLSVKGLFVSNELADALSPEKVLFTKKGVVKTAITIPIVKKELVKELAVRGAVDEEEIVRRNKEYVRRMGLPDTKGGFYLDKEKFIELMSAISGEFPEEGREKTAANLWFIEHYADIADVSAEKKEALEELIDAGQEEITASLEGARRGRIVLYLKPEEAEFIRSVAAVMKAGFCETLDYGHSMYELAMAGDDPLSNIRTYGHGGSGSNVYAKPSYRDITTDVNFSVLHVTGKKQGMATVFYGDQWDTMTRCITDTRAEREIISKIAERSEEPDDKEAAKRKLEALCKYRRDDPPSTKILLQAKGVDAGAGFPKALWMSTPMELTLEGQLKAENVETEDEFFEERTIIKKPLSVEERVRSEFKNGSKVIAIADIDTFKNVASAMLEALRIRARGGDVTVIPAAAVTTDRYDAVKVYFPLMDVNEFIGKEHELEATIPTGQNAASVREWAWRYGGIVSTDYRDEEALFREIERRAENKAIFRILNCAYNGKGFIISAVSGVTLGVGIAGMLRRELSVGTKSATEERSGKKTAYILPGTGSEFEGIGRDLYHKSAMVKELYDHAAEVVGCSPEDLFLEKGKDAYEYRIVTAAILVYNVALFKLYEEEQGGLFKPDVLMGHSMGECAAYVVSGAISLEDMLKITQYYVERLKPAEKVKMVMLMGVKPDDIKNKTEEGEFEIGCYNAPGNIVCAGTETAIEKIRKEKKKHGGRDVKKGIAAHTTLCGFSEDNRKDVKKFIGKKNIRRPQTKVFSPVMGRYLESSEDVKNALMEIAPSVVLWEQSVRMLKADGVEKFLEVWPQKQLLSFVRSIDAGLACEEGYPVVKSALMKEEFMADTAVLVKRKKRAEEICVKLRKDGPSGVREGVFDFDIYIKSGEKFEQLAADGGNANLSLSIRKEKDEKGLLRTLLVVETLDMGVGTGTRDALRTAAMVCDWLAGKAEQFGIDLLEVQGTSNPTVMRFFSNFSTMPFDKELLKGRDFYIGPANKESAFEWKKMKTDKNEELILYEWKNGAWEKATDSEKAADLPDRMDPDKLELCGNGEIKYDGNKRGWFFSLAEEITLKGAPKPKGDVTEERIDRDELLQAVEQQAETAIPALVTADGYIRKGSMAEIVVSENINKNKKNITRTDGKEITDIYMVQLVSLLERFLERVGLGEKEHANITRVLEEMKNGRKIMDNNEIREIREYRVYDFNYAVKGKEDFFLGWHGTRNMQILISTKLIGELAKRGPPRIIEEYLLHELICPIVGHHEAISLQKKMFPEHYRQSDVKDPEKGLLGEALRGIIADGVSRENMTVSVEQGPDNERTAVFMIGDEPVGRIELKEDENDPEILNIKASKVDEEWKNKGLYSKMNELLMDLFDSGEFKDHRIGTRWCVVNPKAAVALRNAGWRPMKTPGALKVWMGREITDKEGNKRIPLWAHTKNGDRVTLQHFLSMHPEFCLAGAKDELEDRKMVMIFCDYRLVKKTKEKDEFEQAVDSFWEKVRGLGIKDPEDFREKYPLYLESDVNDLEASYRCRVLPILPAKNKERLACDENSESQRSLSAIRRFVGEKEEELGFDWSVGYSINDVLGNVPKYADYGFFVFRVAEKRGELEMEMFIIDNGKGIEDTKKISKTGATSKRNILEETKALTDRISAKEDVAGAQAAGTDVPDELAMLDDLEKLLNSGAIEIPRGDSDQPATGDNGAGTYSEIDMLGDLEKLLTEGGGIDDLLKQANREDVPGEDKICQNWEGSLGFGHGTALALEELFEVESYAKGPRTGTRVALRPKWKKIPSSPELKQFYANHPEHFFVVNSALERFSFDELDAFMHEFKSFEKAVIHTLKSGFGVSENTINVDSNFAIKRLIFEDDKKKKKEQGHGKDRDIGVTYFTGETVHIDINKITGEDLATGLYWSFAHRYGHLLTISAAVLNCNKAEKEKIRVLPDNDTLQRHVFYERLKNGALGNNPYIGGLDLSAYKDEMEKDETEKKEVKGSPNAGDLAWADMYAEVVGAKVAALIMQKIVRPIMTDYEWESSREWIKRRFEKVLKEVIEQKKMYNECRNIPMEYVLYARELGFDDMADLFEKQLKENLSREEWEKHEKHMDIMSEFWENITFQSGIFTQVDAYRSENDLQKKRELLESAREGIKEKSSSSLRIEEGKLEQSLLYLEQYIAGKEEQLTRAADDAAKAGIKEQIEEGKEKLSNAKRSLKEDVNEELTITELWKWAQKTTDVNFLELARGWRARRGTVRQTAFTDVNNSVKFLQYFENYKNSKKTHDDAVRLCHELTRFDDPRIKNDEEPGEKRPKELTWNEVREIAGRFDNIAPRELFVLKLAIIFHDYGKILGPVEGVLYSGMLAGDYAGLLEEKGILTGEERELLVALVELRSHFNTLHFGEGLPSVILDYLEDKKIDEARYFKLASFLYLADVSVADRGKLSQEVMETFIHLSTPSNMWKIERSWPAIRLLRGFFGKGKEQIMLSEFNRKWDREFSVIPDQKEEDVLRTFLKERAFFIGYAVVVFRNMSEISENGEEALVRFLYLLSKMDERFLSKDKGPAKIVFLPSYDEKKLAEFLSEKMTNSPVARIKSLLERPDASYEEICRELGMNIIIDADKNVFMIDLKGIEQCPAAGEKIRRKRTDGPMPAPAEIIEGTDRAKRQVLNAVGRYIKDKKDPVDIFIDLTTMNRRDIKENMKTWALLVTSCRGMENINFILEKIPSRFRDFDIEGDMENFSGEEKQTLKGLIEDISNAPEEEEALLELEKHIRAAAEGLNMSAEETEDLIKTRLRGAAPREGAVKVPILAASWLRYAFAKGMDIDKDEYPVALEEETTRDGMDILRNFEAALTIGLAEASLAMAKRKGQDATGQEEYKKLKTRILEKLQRVYSAVRDDIELTTDTLDNIVSELPGVKLKQAIRFALPPVVRMRYEELAELHKSIQFFLMAA